MFVIKERKYPLINSKYQVEGFNELLNNTFDGGLQLFLGKKNRHIFIDLNKDTFECYSISVLLDAFKFSITNFKFKHTKDISLYYKRIMNKEKDILYCENFELKSFIDYSNKLILFGDITTCKECYQFFRDTYCVLDNNKLKLLVIKVDDYILKHIRNVIK